MRDIEFKEFEIGSYQRRDETSFVVTARLYLMPDEYDYWLVPIDAHHKDWGHMRYVALVPKRITKSPDLVIALARRSVFDQLKFALERIDKEGKNIGVYFSPDGWQLI